MTNELYARIARETALCKEALIATRRRLYMHPELSGQEAGTGTLIAHSLRGLGMEVRGGIGGHGVAAVLRGGMPGGLVAWRADMDALPLCDAINTPYRSRVGGVKHGCGHDVHTAIALGIAEVLASLRDRLPGDIQFIFQPCEEEDLGARRMLADGLFDEEVPRAVHGLHVGITRDDGSYLRAGQLGLQYGTVLYGADCFAVEACFDTPPSNLEGELRALIWLLWRLNDYEIPCVEQAGHQYIGLRVVDQRMDAQASRIVAYATYGYAARGYRADIHAELSRLLRVYTETTGARVALRLTQSIPPVYNEAGEARRAEAVLRPLVGDSLLVSHEAPAARGCDDYAVLQAEAGAGMHFSLGAANPARGIVAGLHTAGFDVDEACIPFGVLLMSTYLYQWLEDAR